MYSTESENHTKPQLLVLNCRVMYSLWRHFKWQLHSAPAVLTMDITQLKGWHWKCLWLTLITDCHCRLCQLCCLTASDHKINLDFSDVKKKWKRKQINKQTLYLIKQSIPNPSLSHAILYAVCYVKKKIRYLNSSNRGFKNTHHNLRL